MMIYHPQRQDGFALLMSLIVVGTVVSVGLTVLDITLKQLRLSTGSRDSEIAFHAANAGAECLRFWRQDKQDEFETGTHPLTINCFGGDLNLDFFDLNNNTYLYTGEFSWSPAPNDNRCTLFTVMTINPDNVAVTRNDMRTHLPGYPDTDKTCAALGRCTIISVQGYNRNCLPSFPVGTVQREVLLEL